MKQQNKKKGFPGMLLGTLGASLLGNLLTGTDLRADDGVIKANEETVRAGQYF